MDVLLEHELAPPPKIDPEPADLLGIFKPGRGMKSVSPPLNFSSEVLPKAVRGGGAP